MNLQERYDQLVQEAFVGREDEVEHFLHHLSLPFNSSERHYIFNVYGPKGVGKSTLLRRYRYLAREELNFPVVSAWVSENTSSVLDTLAHIADPFLLPHFQEQFQFFKHRFAELKDSEPARQQTVDLSQPTDLHRKISLFFSLEELQSLCFDLGIEFENIAGGTRQAKATSLVGYCNRHDLRADLIARCAHLRPHVDWQDTAMVAHMREEFDEDALWEAHVRRHVADEAQVELLLHPAAMLTPMLLTDLHQALGSTIHLLLFVDGYGDKQSFLEPWLCHLVNGRFGTVPSNITMILAGETPLTGSCWDTYQQFISQQHLEPFTESEARDFLQAKGIDDSSQIDHLLSTVKMPGRQRYLMLDLATAVASGGTIMTGSSHKTKSTVALFLKIIEEKQYRDTVLRAALPRRLDENILALLMDQDDISKEINWLIFWPFIKASGADTWTYHDHMRDELLAYSRHVATANWSEQQERLIAYHIGYRARLNEQISDQWHHPDWQTATLDIIYHRLCQSRASRRRHVSSILGDFLFALQADPKFAGRWADTVAQAGHDCGSRHIQEWGNFLKDGVQAHAAGDHEKMTIMLSKLLERKTLEDRHRVIALRWRGDSCRHLHYEQKAITDYNNALAINPDYAWAYAGRAETKRWLEQYDEAIADFNKATDLEPEFVWAIAGRAQTRHQLKQYEEAIKDFTHAVELNPGYAWAVAERGKTYQKMGKYENALADFNKTLELDPNYHWALADRGETYRLMGDATKATEDFEKALANNPNDALTHRRLERVLKSSRK